MFSCQYSSPVGLLEIIASNEAIKSINFIHEKGRIQQRKMNPVLQNCMAQLDEYFSGNRKNFDLYLDPEGTGFQKKVWMELLEIPFGTAVSYLHIAKALGDPNTIRAVGGANGKNPIA